MTIRTVREPKAILLEVQFTCPNVQCNAVLAATKLDGRKTDTSLWVGLPCKESYVFVCPHCAGNIYIDEKRFF